MINPLDFGDYKEVYLQPGEFYFGSGNVRIRTILGSCVSIVMWHPRLAIGGMSHSMLPARSIITGDLDGRYIDESIELFKQKMHKYGTSLDEYQVKLFGGGSMFIPSFKSNTTHLKKHQGISICPICSTHNCTISCLNCKALNDVATKYKLNVLTHHLGGLGHRQIIFELWSGDVWNKQTPLIKNINDNKEMA